MLNNLGIAILKLEREKGKTDQSAAGRKDPRLRFCQRVAASRVSLVFFYRLVFVRVRGNVEGWGLANRRMLYVTSATDSPPVAEVARVGGTVPFFFLFFFVSSYIFLVF
jgi:hypothetical protein